MAVPGTRRGCPGPLRAAPWHLGAAALGPLRTAVPAPVCAAHTLRAAVLGPLRVAVPSPLRTTVPAPVCAAHSLGSEPPPAALPSRLAQCVPARTVINFQFS
jgi:hypothetical protein